MTSKLPIKPLGPEHGTPVIKYTLQAFLTSGWTIFFVAGFKPTLQDTELQKKLHVSWFNVPLIHSIGRLRKIGFFFRSLWWVIAQLMFFAKGWYILKRNKIDLIYTWDVDSAPAAWFLSRLFKIPWVARYLGLGVPIYSQTNEVLWRIRFWQQVLAYKLPADLIIMTDDGTFGDIVLQKLGVERNKIRFWMNGVDKDLFCYIPPTDLAKEELKIDSKYTILAISRLDTSKRVDRIISAMPNIISELPNTVLIVVGDGPERNNLENLAKKLGVERNVMFVGSVPHERTILYYSAADLFVTMYDYSNLGNPLLEAMLAGKCCVALDVGGTSKVMKHLETGYLININHLDSLSEVLIDLLKNQQLREYLGVNARNWALHNLESWAERLEKELREIDSLLTQRNLLNKSDTQKTLKRTSSVSQWSGNND
jgi:glycosyltransferase involved in cell wall biosynthesis